jgi:hypothetical protein
MFCLCGCLLLWNPGHSEYKDYELLYSVGICIEKQGNRPNEQANQVSRLMIEAICHFFFLFRWQVVRRAGTEKQTLVPPVS